MQKCPICERDIQKSQTFPSFLLDEALTNFEKLSGNYQGRLKAFKEFKEKIKLKEVNEGMKVDVKDTEGIWCTGTIKTVLNVENSNFILVHYDKWDSVYDELFSLDSNRLAPIGFYTSRNILRYRLAMNEGNRQAEVINQKVN